MQRKCNDRGENTGANECRAHFDELPHIGPQGIYNPSCPGCCWIEHRWGEFSKKFPIKDENLATLERFRQAHRMNGPVLRPGTKCKTCDHPLAR